jgi:hypothetical protein
MKRYRIVAYVCEGGVVYEVNDLGHSSFQRFYTNNPDGCRYGVAEVDGEVRAYDFFDCAFDGTFQAQPGEYRVFPNESAAVVACALLNHSSAMQFMTLRHKTLTTKG